MKQHTSQNQRKHFPLPLDQVESQNYFSKTNTDRSIQSEYDGHSINTLGLLSVCSRNRKYDCPSAKSRSNTIAHSFPKYTKVSTKNMLEFEEFLPDNFVDNTQQATTDLQYRSADVTERNGRENALNSHSSQQVSQSNLPMIYSSTPQPDIKQTSPEVPDELQKLKDQVISIQNDLKNSEMHNKKLEQHIYNQSLQIMSIFQNFNLMKDENERDLPLSLPLVRPHLDVSQPQALKTLDLKKFQNVDHIIAKKTIKMLTQELAFTKQRNQKTIEDYKNLVHHLQKELENRDLKIIKLTQQDTSLEFAQTMPGPINFKDYDTPNRLLASQPEIFKTEGADLRFFEKSLKKFHHQQNSSQANDADSVPSYNVTSFQSSNQNEKNDHSNHEQRNKKKKICDSSNDSGLGIKSSTDSGLETKVGSQQTDDMISTTISRNRSNQATSILEDNEEKNQKINYSPKKTIQSQTCSVHNKIVKELTKKFENVSKKISERSRSTTQKDHIENEIAYIGKINNYIQTLKRRMSSLTPDSKAALKNNEAMKDLISKQKRSQETVTMLNNERFSRQEKINYFKNLSLKSEIIDLLKTTHLNSIKSIHGSSNVSKRSRTPNHVDQPNSIRLMPRSKAIEKRPRSISTLQDKNQKRSESAHQRQETDQTLWTKTQDDALTLQTLDNVIYGGNYLNKTEQTLEPDTHYRQSLPTHEDFYYGLPFNTEASCMNRKMKTAPLSSYLRSVKAEIEANDFSMRPSQRTSDVGLDLKENNLMKTIVLKDNYFRQNICHTEPAFEDRYETQKSTPRRKKPRDSSKSSNRKKSSQGRHQTPTTKVFLDVYSTTDLEESLTNKKIEKNSAPPVTVNSFTGTSSKKLPISANQAEVKKKSNYLKAPKYNSSMVHDYVNMSQTLKSMKQKSQQTSMDHHHNSDLLNEKENKIQTTKSRSSKRQTDASENYSLQFQMKNRRESCKPYNLFSSNAPR